ncbi:hypothetical protein M3D15_04695 [Pseudoclavibacter alba]|uniref:Uncharacterized protein n=1 Tax=Pseudoclavibacter albus TaxID=272241 RepID=A0ABT2HWC9_9MICO|nr:hypothetical protein [Pseudoclavibacter alba]MCT2042633.1 hypothetical protein [Pseudoclavibacter alba]
MNQTEVGKILTYVSAVDNRKLTKESVLAWHQIIGDLVFEDAMEAVVRHFKESAGWLMPVHVVDGVKRIHYERSRVDWAHRQLAEARETHPGLDEWRWWTKLAREDGVSAFTREYAQRQADGLERKAING